MTADTKKTAKSHDDVLEEIADALDIPPSKYEEATKRYESIGAWLDREHSSLAKHDPKSHRRAHSCSAQSLGRSPTPRNTMSIWSASWAAQSRSSPRRP